MNQLNSSNRHHCSIGDAKSDDNECLKLRLIDHVILSDVGVKRDTITLIFSLILGVRPKFALERKYGEQSQEPRAKGDGLTSVRGLKESHDLTRLSLEIEATLSKK